MLKGLLEGCHTERWVATEAGQNLTPSCAKTRPFEIDHQAMRDNR